MRNKGVSAGVSRFTKTICNCGTGKVFKAGAIKVYQPA